MKYLLIILLFLPFNLQSRRGNQGCCSWHGGVAGCDESVGRLVCKDGTYSPSCGCRLVETTPQPMAISSYGSAADDYTKLDKLFESYVNNCDETAMGMVLSSLEESATVASKLKFGQYLLYSIDCEDFMPSMIGGVYQIHEILEASRAIRKINHVQDILSKLSKQNLVSCSSMSVHLKKLYIYREQLMVKEIQNGAFEARSNMYSFLIQSGRSMVKSNLCK